MIITQKLSFKQKKIGRNQLLLFSFFNGIVLTFIAGNVLSLYLLQIGFSASTVAILASLAYIGALFAFLGKWFIAKLGASSTIKLTWFLCGISAICLSLVPFIQHKGFVNNAETILIGAVFLIYCILKSIGTSAVSPLMGEYTDDENRGKFTSKYFLFYNVATIIAILSLIFLYFGYGSLIIFQIVIFLGGIIIIFSSFILSRTKETSVPMESARRLNTKKLLSLIWKTKQYRNFLIARSLARASMFIIIPISIIALKETYGITNQVALIFACIQLLGGFVVTYLYGLISDYTGSKPLIIINVIALSLICFLWLYMPHTFLWGYFIVTFFIGGVCLLGLDSSLHQYYLTIIPSEDRVGVSLWMLTIGGVVAGIGGIVISGGLIKLLSMFVLDQHIFKFYYASMLVILIPVLYYVCHLKISKDDEWSTKDVLKLLITPIKIFSLFTIRRYSKYSSEKNELFYVNQLQGISYELSEKFLIYYLESPDYFVRTSAINALYNSKLGEKAKLALYKFLQSHASAYPLDISIMLAKNPFPKAIPLFRSFLTDADYSYVYSGMIALAIMKDKESYKRIISIFKESENQHLVSFGAKAIGLMNDRDSLDCLLEKINVYTFKRNKILEKEIVIAISKIISCNEVYYKYIRIFQYDKNEGLLGLLDSLKKDKLMGLSSTPEKIMQYYYINRKDPERKLVFINFLIEALQCDTPEMHELKIFKDYFINTAPNLISRRLMACIFIKIFSETKLVEDDIETTLQECRSTSRE